MSLVVRDDILGDKVSIDSAWFAEDVDTYSTYGGLGVLLIVFIYAFYWVYHDKPFDSSKEAASASNGLSLGVDLMKFFVWIILIIIRVTFEVFFGIRQSTLFLYQCVSAFQFFLAFSFLFPCEVTKRNKSGVSIAYRKKHSSSHIFKHFSILWVVLTCFFSLSFDSLVNRYFATLICSVFSNAFLFMCVLTFLFNRQYQDITLLFGSDPDGPLARSVLQPAARIKWIFFGFFFNFAAIVMLALRDIAVDQPIVEKSFFGGSVFACIFIAVFVSTEVKSRFPYLLEVQKSAAAAGDLIPSSSSPPADLGHRRPPSSLGLALQIPADRFVSDEAEEDAKAVMMDTQMISKPAAAIKPKSLPPKPVQLRLSMNRGAPSPQPVHHAHLQSVEMQHIDIPVAPAPPVDDGYVPPPAPPPPVEDADSSQFANEADDRVDLLADIRKGPQLRPVGLPPDKPQPGLIIAGRKTSSTSGVLLPGFDPSLL